jgi:hypothetical protein
VAPPFSRPDEAKGVKDCSEIHAGVDATVSQQENRASRHALLLEQEPAQKGFLFAGDSENGARSGGVEEGLNHAASRKNEYGFVAEAECSLRN